MQLELEEMPVIRLCAVGRRSMADQSRPASPAMGGSQSEPADGDQGAGACEASLSLTGVPTILEDESEECGSPVVALAPTKEKAVGDTSPNSETPSDLAAADVGSATTLIYHAPLYRTQLRTGAVAQLPLPTRVSPVKWALAAVSLLLDPYHP